jgi:hypothetical protein
MGLESEEQRVKAIEWSVALYGAGMWAAGIGSGENRWFRNLVSEVDGVSIVWS